MGSNLRIVQIGLYLVFFALVATAAAVFIPMIGAAMGNFRLLMAFAGISVMLVLGAIVANLVGNLLCLAVPAESGARGYLIAALCCNFVAGIMNYGKNGWGGLLSLLGFGLFLLFLSALGKWFGRGDISDMVGNVVKMALGGFLLIIGGAILQMLIMMLVGVLLMCGSVVFYGMIVFSLGQIAGQYSTGMA